MKYARTQVYLPPLDIERNHSSPLFVEETKDDDLTNIIREERKLHLNVGNAGTLMVKSKRTVNVRFE
jgi:hypothetical protein